MTFVKCQTSIMAINLNDLFSVHLCKMQYLWILSKYQKLPKRERRKEYTERKNDWDEEGRERGIDKEGDKSGKREKERDKYGERYELQNKEIKNSLWYQKMHNPSFVPL